MRKKFAHLSLCFHWCVITLAPPLPSPTATTATAVTPTTKTTITTTTITIKTTNSEQNNSSDNNKHKKSRATLRSLHKDNIHSDSDFLFFSSISSKYRIKEVKRYASAVSFLKRCIKTGVSSDWRDTYEHTHTHNEWEIELKLGRGRGES